MVSPQEMNFVWISYFVGQKQTYSLQTLLPSINIIPKKQVVCRRRIATIFKKPQQVLVLTMYITCKTIATLGTLEDVTIAYLSQPEYKLYVSQSHTYLHRNANYITWFLSKKIVFPPKYHK